LSKEKELRDLVGDVALLQDKLAIKRQVLETLLRRQEEITQNYSSGLPAKLKEAAAQAEVSALALALHLSVIKQTPFSCVLSFHI
jgi:hypothetical protein